MRWHDTTGLMRWNRENRPTIGRQFSRQSKTVLTPDNHAPTNNELVVKAAALRADWEKAHNESSSATGTGAGQPKPK